MNKDPSISSSPESSDAGSESHELSADQSPEALRRGFLKRFGRYAAVTPVVTFTLMSSMSSKAIASGGAGEDNLR